MTRVVAILAHPDDAEILAGGTLYQHRQRGDNVEICSVTYTADSVRGHEGAAGAQRRFRLGLRFRVGPGTFLTSRTGSVPDRPTAFLTDRQRS